jgi:hypothetical protein
MLGRFNPLRSTDDDDVLATRPRLTGLNHCCLQDVEIGSAAQAPVQPAVAAAAPAQTETDAHSMRSYTDTETSEIEAKMHKLLKDSTQLVADRKG